MKPSPRKNIVVFTWHSEKNVTLTTQLLCFFQNVCRANVFVITTDATGKLRLLKNRYQSLTVNEILITYTVDKTAFYLAPPLPDEHPIDLHLNWLYTPKDPVSLAHPSRSATRHYYEWKRQQLISAYCGFLSDANADSVMTWNGSLLVTGTLAESAGLLGIPTFYLERGLLPGSLVIDHSGVNNDSSIAGTDWRIKASTKPTLAEVDALKAYCQQLGSSGTSIVNTGQKKNKEAVLAQLDLSPEKPVILLPLQIESDSNIQKNSPYFKSMEELISSVTSVLDGTGAQLIVKPHPEDRSRRDRIEALCSTSDVRCCWELSLQSLLPVTDLVVVINSTVGLEALLQNKPVVALGQSIYDRKGFTLDLDSRTNLGALIHRALNTLWQPHDNPDFWWFLKTLVSNHTFFYDQQPGLTDVKPHLCEMLLGKSAQPVTPMTSMMQELILTNETLSQLMKGEFTGRVLVIGPLETIMEEIPGQITILNRAARPFTFLSALTHQYELMICMEWPSSLFLRAFLTLLRTKRKIILG